MQKGDIINIQLKSEPTPRQLLTVHKIDHKGIHISPNQSFDWEDIDDIETIAAKPDFKDFDKVVVDGVEHVRYQNKWFKGTNIKDNELISAVETGTAKIKKVM